MYIKNDGHTYYRGTEQCRSRGEFLVLVQTDKSAWKETRAIVRKVALRQFGHWMIGTARAFGESITISGAYGSDGLPRTVSQAIYDRAIPVPANLMDALNNGEGWNGAGSEAPLMRQWALDNLESLK